MLIGANKWMSVHMCYVGAYVLFGAHRYLWVLIGGSQCCFLEVVDGA